MGAQIYEKKQPCTAMRNTFSQSLPKDLEDKIQAFHAEVSSIFDNSDFPLEFICNMDETPVYLDLLPRKVIAKKGQKSINVRTTGSEKIVLRQCYVVLLLGRYSPHLLFSKEKLQGV